MPGQNMTAVYTHTEFTAIASHAREPCAVEGSWRATSACERDFCVRKGHMCDAKLFGGEQPAHLGGATLRELRRRGRDEERVEIVAALAVAQRAAVEANH